MIKNIVSKNLRESKHDGLRSENCFCYRNTDGFLDCGSNDNEKCVPFKDSDPTLPFTKEGWKSIIKTSETMKFENVEAIVEDIKNFYSWESVKDNYYFITDKLNYYLKAKKRILSSLGNEMSDESITISKEVLRKHFKDTEDFIEESFEIDIIDSSWIKDIKERNEDILNNTVNLRDRRWEYIK